MKLTGPNRPYRSHNALTTRAYTCIAIIHANTLIIHKHQPPHRHTVVGWIRRPGGYGGRLPPDPIPNSAVKRPSAYDTASQDAEKSVAARSPDPPHKTHPTTHAGWSSPVARQAHNLKAAGSNPAPATKIPPQYTIQAQRSSLTENTRMYACLNVRQGTKAYHSARDSPAPAVRNH